MNCAILPVFPNGSSELGLQGLSPDDSIRLLRELGMIAPPEKLRELAHSLVYHPLALTGFAGVAGKLGVKWESLIPAGQIDPSKRFHALLSKIREHLPDAQCSERLLIFCSLLPEGATIEILDWMLRSHSGGAPQSDGALLARVLALADWSLLLWDRQTSSARLHGLVAAYFAELIPDAEKRALHSCAADWYELRASACAVADRGHNAVLAVRHAIRAKESRLARRIMFGDGHAVSALFDWLTFNGHLWECAELLADLKEICSELDQTPCILARVHILHELELSHRALADVQKATTLILAQSGPLQFTLQPSLARCYGVQGLIHVETGRATEALPFFDKAVILFESFAALTSSSQFDLAKTLANRGLAKWCCGDWDGASADYKRTLDLLHAELAARSSNLDAEVMALEIQGRLAALHLDRGEPAKAARELEPVVLALRTALQKAQTRPQKNHMMTILFLGAAHVAGGHSEQGLDTLQEVVLPLEEMNRQGRSEFNAILAQARVNEAQALLGLGRIAEATHAAERSIRLYEELLAKGATHLQGQLSNALFRRAELRIRFGVEQQAQDDLQRALVIAQDWIRDFFGECNIENVFLANALQILPHLSNRFAQDKRTVLESITQCLDRLLTAPRPNAAVVKARRTLAENWSELTKTAAELGLPWPAQFPIPSTNSID